MATDLVEHAPGEYLRPSPTQNGPRARADEYAVASHYDGFISYRHSDRQTSIARGVQRALHGFAKPWYRLRAVRLYRDETNLNARPDLWDAIKTALDDSRYLLLMASPEAAASKWVDKEVAHWLDSKGSDTLLIIVTDGAVAWNDRLGRFDLEATTALPPVALRRLRSEPFWIDLSWARDARELRIDDARFRDAVASIAATLRGTDKDALTGEDIRQRRRTMRMAWSASGALALLAGTSLLGGALAIRQAEQARREQERATTWADRRLFTINLILAQQVEGNRTFTSFDFTAFDGATFGMYLGWNQAGGRLGKLMTAMRAADQPRFDGIFADGDVAAAEHLISFVNGSKGGVAKDAPDPRFEFGHSDWKDRFQRAGVDVVFQRVQLELALADFQLYRRIIATDMPVFKSERGISFIVDVITQHGPATARRLYNEATTHAASERALIDEIAERSVARAPRSFVSNVKHRRELFRTTPLLLDDPLSAADLTQPSWSEDLMAWSTRLLLQLRGRE